jgi:glycosyltransferase involved in cell wall biosynthesis
MSGLRIVLGNSSLARYPEGGGHWAVRLQYLLGLRALNHDVILLELLWSTGDADFDKQRIRKLFQQLDHYGLADCCALVLFEKDAEQNLDLGSSYGKNMQEIKEIIKSADFLWNDCCGFRQPLLGMFKHRVLVDLDPGVLQISGLTWSMDIADHHAFLTVGRNLHDASCPVPTLGHKWHTFTPFVYLPMWKATPDPGRDRPYSSITHWRWRELHWNDRVLSTSKRNTYLEYIELPQKTGRPFELAVRCNYPEDEERLQDHGWHLVDPWEVAGSTAAYQEYIAASRAEILCAKPIFRELNTGWFSDRSACYLASGRPVLAEDTGFTDYLPTGNGLLAFRDLPEAMDGVAEIDSNYAQHTRAARELAEEFLDSRRCLPAILDACC